MTRAVSANVKHGSTCYSCCFNIEQTLVDGLVEEEQRRYTGQGSAGSLITNQT